MRSPSARRVGQDDITLARARRRATTFFSRVDPAVQRRRTGVTPASRRDREGLQSIVSEPPASPSSTSRRALGAAVARHRLPLLKRLARVSRDRRVEDLPVLTAGPPAIAQRKERGDEDRSVAPRGDLPLTGTVHQKALEAVWPVHVTSGKDSLDDHLTLTRLPPPLTATSSVAVRPVEPYCMSC